jgi:hypothetical protein
MPPPPHHNALPVAAAAGCWAAATKQQPANERGAKQEQTMAATGLLFCQRDFSRCCVCVCRAFFLHILKMKTPTGQENVSPKKKEKKKKKESPNKLLSFSNCPPFLKKKERKKKLTHFLFDAVVRL